MKKNLLKVFLAGIILVSGFSSVAFAAPNNNSKKVQNQKATQNQKNQSSNTKKTRAPKDKKAKEPKIDPVEQAKIQAYYSKPKSGIFLGVGVGASVITRNADIQETTSRQSGDMSLGLGVNWEVKLGWRQYFSNKMGFRIYASYDQTWGFPGQLHTLGLKNLKRDYVLIDRILLNADYLLDLLAEGNRRVTVYIGVYGGYAESNQKYTNVGTTNTNTNAVNDLISNGGNNYDTGYVFGFNAGMSVTFVNRHTIDIGAKIPMLDITSQEYYEPSATNGSNVKLTDTNWRTPTFSVGYSFVF